MTINTEHIPVHHHHRQKGATLSSDSPSLSPLLSVHQCRRHRHMRTTLQPPPPPAVGGVTITQSVPTVCTVVHPLTDCKTTHGRLTQVSVVHPPNMHMYHGRLKDTIDRIGTETGTGGRMCYYHGEGVGVSERTCMRAGREEAITIDHTPVRLTLCHTGTCTTGEKTLLTVVIMTLLIMVRGMWIRTEMIMKVGQLFICKLKGMHTANT